MKKNIIFFLIFIGVASLFLLQPKTSEQEIRKMPKGHTDVLMSMEENKDKGHKKQWLEDIHKVSKGNSWKQIEAKNLQVKNENRLRSLASGQSRDGIESLADDQLTGTWNERGSNNQSGSVIAMDYNPALNELWLVSAGGSIWKRNLDEEYWTVINDKLKFDSRFFHIQQMGENYRYFASINKIIHYSDDTGLTWTESTGLQTYDNNWGNRDAAVFLDDNVALQKINFWHVQEWKQKSSIYMSEDGGVSWDVLDILEGIGSNKYRLYKPTHQDEIYLFKKENEGSGLYIFDKTTKSFSLINQFPDYSPSKYNLTLSTEGLWFSYDGQELFVLNNETNIWDYKSFLPESPWFEGFFISDANPDFMLMGGVECFKSTNGGTSWNKINNWWDYYDNPTRFLHADIMKFKEITTPNNETAIIINNHGGVNVSYDEMDNYDNISIYSNLNVSQYYSVRTLPSDPSWIFAGSQDQGFQRGTSNNDDITLDFDQVISGDYGHIVFTGDNNLWTVYPGGWVSLYLEPRINGHNTSWQLPNSSSSAWITPLVVDPHAETETVYLVGGNNDIDEGSYIHKMELNSNNEIIGEQQAFDFLNESGGYVSSLAFSPFDDQKLYASTSNGLFYYSVDDGLTWEVSSQVGPKPHYLYGTKIVPSNIEEDVVYFAGSGYETFPVYKSSDGGQFFENISDGLPSTLIYDMCFNKDESMAFAATEAGPYVYIKADNRWYDMAGMNAPAQTYWSVEYVESSNIVRFGTYGRGIWDFKIQEQVSNEDISQLEPINIYPTVSKDVIHMDISTNKYNYEIINHLGQITQKGKCTNDIDISSNQNGNYFVRILEGGKPIKQGKFIKI